MPQAGCSSLGPTVFSLLTLHWIAGGVLFDVCVGTDFVALTRERVLHSMRIEVIMCDRQYVKIQLPAVLFLPYPGLPQELFSCYPG